MVARCPKHAPRAQVTELPTSTKSARPGRRRQWFGCHTEPNIWFYQVWREPPPFSVCRGGRHMFATSNILLTHQGNEGHEATRTPMTNTAASISKTTPSTCALPTSPTIRRGRRLRCKHSDRNCKCRGLYLSDSARYTHTSPTHNARESWHLQQQRRAKTIKLCQWRLMQVDKGRYAHIHTPTPDLVYMACACERPDQ